MVIAKCTQSPVLGTTSAAAPPSNQWSVVPSPTFNLNRCLPPASSLKNLKPELRLFGVAGRFGSGGPITKTPARSGELFTFIQNVAENSLSSSVAAGNVKYESAAPA